MTLNVGPSGRVLNPLAAEFVPWFHKQQERKYTGWGREGFDTRAEKNYQYICFQIGPPTCNILDAPEELLHAILLKLKNPADVLATALTSKRMLQVVKEAALSLRVQNKQLEPSNHSVLFRPHWLLPGIVELSLSGCESINNVHIMEAFRHLRSLRWLDLSACRKLNPQVIKRLCMVMPKPYGRSGHLSTLQAIGLQRCFQLDSSALTQILLASSVKDSRLETVTLSHLSLQDWPSNDTAQAFLTNTVTLSRRVAAHCVSWSSLKMLALNNCKKIAPDGLSYLTACCTELQMLFLGGSSMDVPVRPSQGLNTSETPTGDQPSLEGRAIGGSDTYHSRLASALLDAVQPLANLNVLELTFFPGATVSAVALEMPSVQVWDLSQAKFLEAAHQMKQSTSKTKSASNVSLALSAAVNCSSAARHTPLHAAVEADCRFSVKVVLELGGQLEAKDHSGATPLFCACEAGRLGSAVTLMSAGAELRTRNSAGEAPLYIAALKGHERVVEELLAEFKGRGLRWTESDLYGDGWSPLMAAALADRHAIAVRLLQSAGQEAWTLTRAMNKHGQTAAHLAARKGSHMLLMALLNAGGRSIATIRDKNRRTPLDVALASGRDDAILLLKTAAASHGSGHNHAARRTSGKASKLQGHTERHSR